MQKNEKVLDKWHTDKPLYDYNIEFDIEILPKDIQEIINELEELDKQGDWFNYDLKFPILEVQAKSYILNNKISEKDYNKLMRKYGWYE